MYSLCKKGGIHIKMLVWGVQFLIPLVVLYTIGYYIPGFSALTLPWIILLSVLIFLGERFLQWTIRQPNRFGRTLINFLVAAAIIFTLTLAIEGGNVPLGGALLAAVIIAVLTELVQFEKIRIK
jgi:putative membrane protein